MFRRFQHHRLSGFTLVELAIVLGIVGVLASGLWRLMATGTQQTKDVATAQQQATLINAVKGYLADSTQLPAGIGGQAWLASLGPGAASNLPLPAAGGCPGAAGTQAAVFCTYLPPGFSAATTNPYGQKYTIQVVSGSAFAQQNYSFMVVASGGAKPIPDPDGGRISSLIGGDGGFIYSSPVCTAAATTATACGTMGGWKVATVTAAAAAGGYAFATAPGYGSVASLSFVSSALSNNLDWLARVLMPSDPTFAFNTMSPGANFYLGGNNFYFQDEPQTRAAGTMDMEAGNILVDGGNIDVTNNGVTLEADPNGVASQIIGKSAAANSGLGGGNLSLSGDYTLPGGPGTPQVGNPLIQIADGCVAANMATKTFDNCGLAMSISGNVGISGKIQSYVFIYTGSDERLKKDIEPLPSSLDDLMKLRPVSFVYKRGNLLSLGFVAQDLEKIYPQMVTTGPNGMKEVAYDELIAPLVKSVQELKQENDQLKASLRDQAEHQDRLEKEIQELKRK